MPRMDFRTAVIGGSRREVHEWMHRHGYRESEVRRIENRANLTYVKAKGLPVVWLPRAFENRVYAEAREMLRGQDVVVSRC